MPSGAGTELVPYRQLDLDDDRVAIGDSVLGVPIVAERFGTPGGRRVLVIGVIHGNEDAGTAIIDELRQAGAPEDVELWLIESMNPDGQAAGDRHNANAVDLNRNFPYKWGAIGAPGDGQYAGTGPASEPETQAMVNFIAQLRPDIAIWYHQDLYVISPAEGREGRIRAALCRAHRAAAGRHLGWHLHRDRCHVGTYRARRRRLGRLHRRARADAVVRRGGAARQRGADDRRRGLTATTI